MSKESMNRRYAELVTEIEDLKRENGALYRELSFQRTTAAAWEATAKANKQYAEKLEGRIAKMKEIVSEA